MNTETWRKIDGCLAEALELPAGERRAFLHDRLAGDPEAEREACKLADCADEAERLFAHSPVTKYSGLTAGSRIGPWELIRPLGSGGMGVVWMARRADGQATMQAAIKLLPPALTGGRGSELEQRFLVEKQILARLQHPNIARLLDAGAGGGETPNFVMEYVDGLPLLDYLSADPLDKAARLRLFLKICDAVQYAHGNLTIHRDLKPHNILVQPDGEPKLLDFGIGKILNESAGGGSITLHRAFSLDYASPEQIRDGTIRVATDVYSLGLLLFEMLTNTRARQWNDKPLGELLDLAQRFELPAHPALTADLLAVVRKATEIDPDRRYRAVNEFAADVERVLAGHPVQARPAGFGYRAQCFLRRNWIAVTATSAALAAILTLASWAWISARQAEADRAVALDQSRLLQQALDREQAARAAAVRARRASEEKTAEALEQEKIAQEMSRLAATREQDAEERLRQILRIFDRSIFSSREDVAKLAGGTTTAIRLIERTLSQLQEVRPSTSTRAEHLAVQAEGYGWLSELYAGANSNVGNQAKGRETRQRAVDLWHEVTQLSPASVIWRRSYLESRFRLSLLSPNTLDWASFEREFLDLSIRAKDRQSQRTVAQFYFRRALSDKSPSKRQDMLRALEWFTKVQRDAQKPEPQSLRDLALAHKYLAGMQPAAPAERFHHAQEALQLDRQRAALDSSDKSAQLDLAFSISSLGDAYWSRHDLDSARKHFLQAYELRKTLHLGDPENALIKNALLYPIRWYGLASYHLRDWEGLALASKELTWAQSRAGLTPLQADKIHLTFWQGALADAKQPGAGCAYYREAATLLAATQQAALSPNQRFRDPDALAAAVKACPPLQ